MVHHTMPLPRIPDLSLPSFRELDESVEANRRNQPSIHVSSNMYEGTSNSSSSSPQNINTVPNPYPPYPANGWLVPPDPSQNAFREPGFTYQPVNQGSVTVLQPNVNVDRGKKETAKTGISGQKCNLRDHPTEINPTPQLPLRPKEIQSSPTPTQSTLSSAQSTLRGPLSPSTEVSSTPEKVSPNLTRQILTNRQPPNGQARQRVSRDAAATHRAQRRRVGVHFSEVAAHTAKCDVCNKRNKNGMSRCQNCGWQVCRKCLTDRNGDRTHASFGATHVPEGGGDMPVSLPSVDGNQDRRRSDSTVEVRAAQTLLDLGSFGNSTPSATCEVASNGGGQKVAAALAPVLQQQVDALSTDSDMTLSVVGDEEWPQDEPDVPIGEDGLPIGYIITRRNPARAARPSAKMAE
ncbi:uncharacterized protein N7479_006651 [Penicillium vulpinum]|uniref:Uncharacterized protein n=1 Tax=Penicillium vulpinum TaxID=29845 RepID=A0A1V6S2B4_9EURO|nr:uncharacterized protein N7479_006651 [Penicillium vulpinum]KAJ5959501.1 hypothetical protein N7479_006651 [Penicillium vulpinum]OQE08008.1 hypothetical protein PENVUL_c011G04030 [Penicillium vulpinum]